MAKIFGELTNGRWLDVWYHFALMFEALFILTTLDAGTRVGRYLLQDSLGRLIPSLGDTRSLGAGIVASALIVLGWGFFLVLGVRDPDGGVKALWPIFGIANQLLASIALCLATTILLKMQLQRSRPVALVFVTLVPLAWLLSVTLTAGMQKLSDPSPKMGFLAAARAADAKVRDLEAQGATAPPAALKAARTMRFNGRVDAAVTATFLVLVVGVVFLAVREWWRLLGGRRPAELSETQPVILPPDPISGAPVAALGAVALGVALLKEVSGEAELDRAQARAEQCDCAVAQTPTGRRNVFLTTLDDRYRGIRRCC
jgi:carbon starvation protein